MRITLPLFVVERVIRAIYVTSLLGATAFVCGVVSVQGRVIPAVNMRRRFFPERGNGIDQPDRADAGTILPGL
ncbi:MAG: chemotaxis protein CheW [Chloroflexota bacterium]